MPSHVLWWERSVGTWRCACLNECLHSSLSYYQQTDIDLLPNLQRLFLSFNEICRWVGMVNLSFWLFDLYTNGYNKNSKVCYVFAAALFFNDYIKKLKRKTRIFKRTFEHFLLTFLVFPLCNLLATLTRRACEPSGRVSQTLKSSLCIHLFI